MEDKNRTHILNDFSKNILIEAGAGAGKTTILVNRILNQIKTTEITLDKIVAITFTEKAAIGLQERFQENLIKAHLQASGEQKEKLKKAIVDIDKIHISTIHSFCSSMLKEMPFEAGLSLDFTIVQDEEEEQLKRGLFAQFCEMDWSLINPRNNAIREKLEEVGINPEVLSDTFFSICEKDNITWVYDQNLVEKSPQDYFLRAKKIIKQIGDVLEKKADSSIGFSEEELKGGGAIDEDETGVIKEKTCLVYRWFTRHKDSELTFECMKMFDKLDEKMNLCFASNSKKKNFNPDLLKKGKKVNQRLKEYELDRAYSVLINDYENYRHALCMQFLIAAIQYFIEEKKKEKKLTNTDLLVLARDMIKNSHTAREFFSNKYTCFYIDEFQDTNPAQTELIFYLTCRDETLPDHWENCQLKDGTLCMVGDPKQSIYAFTGADIKLYNRVKQKMQNDVNCIVYRLKRNYRSNKQICDWVEKSYSKENSEFGFPNQIKEGSNQAIFEGMTTLAPEHSVNHQTLNGVYRYDLGTGLDEELIKWDASYIAELIAGLIEKKTQINRYDSVLKSFVTRMITPGDFLIITWFTKSMPSYIKALKEKGIPVSVSGKIETKALEEVCNLVNLLTYLDDYRNSYQLALVLEKLFGCHLDDDQRFNYHQIIWNVEEINRLSNERLKESLLIIRNLLVMLGQVPPMVLVEIVVNDFKLIIANKNYDSITINSAMGNIEQLLEVVRSESYSTFSDIVISFQKLTENTLDREMSITDLIEEDGEYNAVRIMNLHKAKGLESNIIILADPSTNVSGFNETMYFIEEDGIKMGYLIPKDSYGHYFGKPARWDEAKAAGKALKDEEYLRLLYVASTRAKEALIVSTGERTSKSGRIMNQTAWKDLKPLIECNQETKEVCGGWLDYQSVAKNCLNQKRNKVDNWEIVNPDKDFIAHKAILDDKIVDAQHPVARHLNPSKFLNHSIVVSNEVAENKRISQQFRGNFYGIIIHKLFQLLVDGRYSKTADLTDANLEILMKKSILAGLDSEGLSKKQCKIFNIDESLEGANAIEQLKAIYNELHDDLRLRIDNFRDDDGLWEKIVQADYVYTELPFQLAIEVEEIDDLVDLIDLEEDDVIEKIYMRGIMDLVIVNGKNYTIIDYKTNAKVGDENLAEFKEYLCKFYQPQLKLYERAMREMVEECLVESEIYSLYE